MFVNRAAFMHMDLISPVSAPAQAARKVDIVRTLRLFALVAVVALVYLAQYIFDHGSLADFYPDWVLALFPALQRTTRWLPVDLLVFARWISAIGLLGFGLLSPMWRGETNRLYRRLAAANREAASQPRQSAAWELSIMALTLALAVFSTVIFARGPEPSWLWVVWLGSVGVLLGAGVVASWGMPGVSYARRYAALVRPGQVWYGLAFLLVLLTLLYTFELRALPPRVDRVTAVIGLQVRQWLQGEATGFFGGKWGELAIPGIGLPLFITWLVRDGLLGARLAGALVGPAMVSGVWLVASELFRRAPRYGEFGEVLEDDGRWLTLMAAALSAVGVAVYHFARMPLFLEGTAVGTLSIWALLYGLRQDRPWLLGIGGLCLGWTWFYGSAALTFTMVAAAVWIGAGLLERGWVTGKAVAVRDAAAVPVQRGARWLGFGLWAVGFWVVIAPTAGLWIGGFGAVSGPTAWRPIDMSAIGALDGTSPALAQLGTNLRLALLGLNQLPDQSGLVSTNSHLLPSLLAPLLMLAVGSLLLNMDSLMGWVIVTWLGSALAGAAITGPVQPFWPSMLPLLPAAALALAYVMDRMRTLLMETLGTWTLQATVYLALGVAVAAGMVSWVDFYEAAHNGSDLASAVGRAADATPPDVQLILVDGQENLGNQLAQPVVQFLAGDERVAETVLIQAGIWPPTLPLPARLLVAPADLGLIPQISIMYPDGVWQVQRSLNANPVLYIYDLSVEP